MEVCSPTKLYSGYIVTMLIAILLFISYPQPASAAKVSKIYTNFINSSCNTTTYPSLCVKTLTPYASKVKTSSLKLCNAGLKVATQAARNASNTVSKLAKQKGITSIEAAVIQDCIEDVKDAVYELKQTLDAMEHIEDADKEYQWANAKTWASAAITDTDSCLEGFSGRNVSATVKNKIISSMVNVGRLTSNALSLINHLY